MRKLHLFTWALCMSVLCSCHSQTAVSGSISDEKSETLTRSDSPPTNKEVIYMVMQLHDVPLQVHPSCEGMGMDFDDTTIGQFLSGFWAYQTDPDGEGGLTIDVAEGDNADGIARWETRVMIGGMTEETPYQVGISFNIRAADRAVEVESIRCLGAG